MMLPASNGGPWAARTGTPVSAMNQFSILPAQSSQPVVAQTPRKTLRNLAYHLRDQARIIQLNQPESLDQYRSLGILFDLVDLCEEASAIDGKRGEDPKNELQRLFWRAVEILKACPVDGLSPFRSYGLRLEHTIQSMWAAYAQRPSVKELPAAYAVPEIRLLPVGSQVEYYSNTYRRWMEATVLGHLPDGDYQLDIQGHAKKDNVRALLPKRVAPVAIGDRPETKLQLEPGSAATTPGYSEQSSAPGATPGAASSVFQDHVDLIGGGVRETSPYAPGTIVEYWSTSMSQWILAEVIKWNPKDRSYHLDCKNNAPRDRIRPHNPDRVRGPLGEHTRPLLQKFEGGELEEAPASATKEKRDQDEADDPSKKVVVKTHHDMQTGRIVRTQIGPEGDATKFIYDTQDGDFQVLEPAMRRSAVIREQTADFIRNSGATRMPPQMNVTIMTQDKPPGGADADGDARYIDRVNRIRHDAEHKRKFTEHKVEQLAMKAQQLVERLAKDEEKMDVKTYAIPKLSAVTPYMPGDMGWGQSRSSTAAARATNPYMREYYDGQADEIADRSTIMMSTNMEGTTDGAFDNRASGRVSHNAPKPSTRATSSTSGGASKSRAQEKTAKGRLDLSSDDSDDRSTALGRRKPAWRRKYSDSEDSGPKLKGAAGKGCGVGAAAKKREANSSDDDRTTLGPNRNNSRLPAWKVRASPFIDTSHKPGSDEGSEIAQVRSRILGNKNAEPDSDSEPRRPAAKKKVFGKKQRAPSSDSEEKSDSGEFYSDADTSLTQGTRGQSAWDFVPTKKTSIGSSSSGPQTKPANPVKKGVDASRASNDDSPPATRTGGFGLRAPKQRARPLGTRPGASPGILRATSRCDSDDSPTRRTSIASSKRKASYPMKKNSYRQPPSSHGESPTKGDRENSELSDTATPKWTPWGGHFGLGRFGKIDSE
ncbi:unnamed protein product [Amoebophrya sp. A25]|nr:unnamed protein product [Amoebophrya sp. A25]|eukprot:GSA25T00007746001.1